MLGSHSPILLTRISGQPSDQRWRLDAREGSWRRKPEPPRLATCRQMWPHRTPLHRKGDWLSTLREAQLRPSQGKSRHRRVSLLDEGQGEEQLRGLPRPRREYRTLAYAGL